MTTQFFKRVGRWGSWNTRVCEFEPAGEKKAADDKKSGYKFWMEIQERMLNFQLNCPAFRFAENPGCEADQ